MYRRSTKQKSLRRSKMGFWRTSKKSRATKAWRSSQNEPNYLCTSYSKDGYKLSTFKGSKWGKSAYKRCIAFRDEIRKKYPALGEFGLNCFNNSSDAAKQCSKLMGMSATKERVNKRMTQRNDKRYYLTQTRQKNTRPLIGAGPTRTNKMKTFCSTKRRGCVETGISDCNPERRHQTMKKCELFLELLSNEDDGSKTRPVSGRIKRERKYEDVYLCDSSRGKCNKYNDISKCKNSKTMKKNQKRGLNYVCTHNKKSCRSNCSERTRRQERTRRGVRKVSGNDNHRVSSTYDLLQTSNQMRPSDYHPLQ